MSPSVLPLLVLVLAPVLVLVVPAPAPQCPSPQLCRSVCAISPVLAGRCESCHPGVCSPGYTGEPFLPVYRGRPPPRSKTSSPDEDADKSEEDSKPLKSESIGQAEDGEVTTEVSPGQEFFEEDYEGPTTQANVPEGSIAEDDGNASNEGSGWTEGKDSEREANITEEDIVDNGDGDVTTESSPGKVGTFEDVPQTFEEPAPKEPEPEDAKPDEAEPKETGLDENEAKETESRETELEETEPQETEPQETKPEEAELEETEPQETEPQKPQPEETKPEETEPVETKPEETKPEEIKPEETKVQETELQESESEETGPQGTEPGETGPQEAEPGEAKSQDSESQAPEPQETFSEEPKEKKPKTQESESKKPSAEGTEGLAPPASTARGGARAAGGSELTCLHNGVYHPLHTNWFDMDHCNLHVCTTLGVQTTSLTGACRPPPQGVDKCTRYRPPGQCCYNYDCDDSSGDTTEHSPCVDSFGAQRPHNSNWTDDSDHPCVHYLCTDGVVVVLSDMRPLCPRPPSHSCIGYRLDDHCCNSFNCTDEPAPLACLDAQGVRRDDGQSWFDNDIIPCRKFICNNGMVGLLEDVSAGCKSSPGPGCAAVAVPGQCCAAFTSCSCLLDGVEYISGSVFADSEKHPCSRLRCENGTLETLEQRVCPTLNCSSSFRRPGSCCYDCVGCVHEGVRRSEGSFWFDDPQRPCVLYTCTDSVVVEVNRTVCTPSLDPHCQPITTPGQCCALFDCTEAPCVVDGVTREHGSTWPENPFKPCVFLGCNNSVVSVVRVTEECEPPPEPHCVGHDVPFQCCPTYDCANGLPVTCPYGDQTYSEGDIWVDNPVYPCKWFTCSRTGVQLVNSTYCPPLAPPDCPSQRQPGQCCYTCQTPVTCYYEGQTYSEGDIWMDSPVYPCKWFTCSRAGVQLVNNTYCPSLAPPDCPSQRQPGQCCYTCQTPDQSACIDANGVVRGDGEVYYNDADRCMLARCAAGQERLIVDRTKLCLPPPGPNCTVVGTVNCCPQYLCQLSPVFNCMDASGVRRQEGDIYADDVDGCRLVRCVDGTEDLLVDRRSLCSPPDSQTSCVMLGVEDCCPVYDCSGPANCVDAAGTQHAEGDMYYDDTAGCRLVKCSGGQELLQVDRTELCSPPPANPACSLQATLGCCPIYSCPDCTYNGQTHAIGTRWWDDPLRQCVQFRCSAEGLVEQELSRLPCAEVRHGCVPIRDEPACCHHKYNCMFDHEHNLIPMTELPF